MAWYQVKLTCPVCEELVKVDSDGEHDTNQFDELIAGHCENCGAYVRININISIVADEEIAE
jgi:transcription elongation factor Elf1